MLDLDAIEARANDTVVTSIFRHNVEFAISFASKRMRPAGEITVHDDGRAAQFWKVPELLAELAAARADIPALVAELRAAREVVKAAHKWKSALTWDAEWSIRPAEVGSTLQRKSELLEALAAPAGAHVHYDDFYDPAGELDDDFDAYRAVVGEV